MAVEAHPVDISTPHQRARAAARALLGDLVCADALAFRITDGELDAFADDPRGWILGAPSLDVACRTEHRGALQPPSAEPARAHRVVFTPGGLTALDHPTMGPVGVEAALIALGAPSDTCVALLAVLDGLRPDRDSAHFRSARKRTLVAARAVHALRSWWAHDPGFDPRDHADVLRAGLGPDAPALRAQA